MLSCVQNILYEEEEHCEVAPHAGAWIEILDNYEHNYRAGVAPTRARGLKFEPVRIDEQIAESRPTRA